MIFWHFWSSFLHILQLFHGQSLCLSIYSESENFSLQNYICKIYLKVQLRIYSVIIRLKNRQIFVFRLFPKFDVIDKIHYYIRNQHIEKYQNIDISAPKILTRKILGHSAILQALIAYMGGIYEYIHCYFSIYPNLRIFVK